MSTRCSIAYGQVAEGPEDFASWHWWEEVVNPDPKFPFTLSFTIDTKRIYANGCIVELQVSKEMLMKLREDLLRWRP